MKYFVALFGFCGGVLALVAGVILLNWRAIGIGVGLVIIGTVAHIIIQKTIDDSELERYYRQPSKEVKNNYREDEHFVFWNLYLKDKK